MITLYYNKKLLIVLLVSVLICICLCKIVSSKFSSIYIFFYNRESISCYRFAGETLTDITTINVRQGESIFFHETSCNSYVNNKIVISSRQACAVESAALANPNRDVYLLFTSPGTIKFEGSESDRFLQALLSYDNIKIHHLDYVKYTKGTPLEELYKNGTLEASHYAIYHASDVLRYLTLWKYGGTYMDLDVVVIKNFETLPPNFSGCECETDVSAGIMGFQPNGTGNGHSLAEECVLDLRSNFSRTNWGSNGPGVITRNISSSV